MDRRLPEMFRIKADDPVLLGFQPPVVTDDPEQIRADIREKEADLHARNLRPKTRLDLQVELASLYLADKAPLKALGILRSAYRDSIERGEIEAELSILRRLSLIEASLGNYREAIRLFRHALHRRPSGSRNYFLKLAENYYAQGVLFLQKPDVATARIYFNHARTYASCCGNDDFVARADRALEALQRF